MIDTPHISGVAHLIGDTARATMLAALKYDHCLSSTELSRVAGVAPSTASEHLAMLTHGGLVVVEASGRHRYYRLAGPEVADALESMESLATAVIPADRLAPPAGISRRFARVCYDHLAGALGVALAQSLVAAGHLKETKKTFAWTGKGRHFFAELGIDLAAIDASPRVPARKCADWSERLPHLGGALGAALLARLMDLKWLQARKGSRSVRLTARGRRKLRGLVDITCDIHGG